MQAHPARGGEVDLRSSRRNLGARKQRPAAKVEVRHDATVRIEIPDQRKGIYRGAIRRIRRLKNQEDGDRIDSVLETSAQQARAMRRRDDPAIAKPRSPDAGMLRDPIRSVSPGSPELYFVSVGLRPILCAGVEAKPARSNPQKSRKIPMAFINRFPRDRMNLPIDGKTIPELVRILNRSCRTATLGCPVFRDAGKFRYGLQVSQPGSPEDSQEWLSYNAPGDFFKRKFS